MLRLLASITERSCLHNCGTTCIYSWNNLGGEEPGCTRNLLHHLEPILSSRNIFLLIGGVCCRHWNTSFRWMSIFTLKLAANSWTDLKDESGIGSAFGFYRSCWP